MVMEDMAQVVQRLAQVLSGDIIGKIGPEQIGQLIPAVWVLW